MNSEYKVRLHETALKKFVITPGSSPKNTQNQNPPADGCPN